MKSLDKAYYNSVLSGTFSSCGSHFLAGSTYGDIQIFNLRNILNSAEIENSEDVRKLLRNRSNFYSNPAFQVSSLISNDTFLIAGIGDEIYGWLWDNVLNNGSENFAWKIQLPQTTLGETKNEINCLKIGPESGTSSDYVLYAGCSNSNLYSYSLEDGRLLKTFQSHADYIHSIDVRDNLLASGGEDGCIVIRDNRAPSPVNTIKPFTHSELLRPDLGNWIGDLSLNEDWLVCGGGVRLSLWSLRTLDCPMTVFSNTKDSGIHLCQFRQDKIIAGGSAPFVSVLSYNDELHAGLQSSSSTIYGSAFSTEHSLNKIACFFGNDNKIDVTTNLSYREFDLPFY